MNSAQLFSQLLHAEHEDQVISILNDAGYSVDDDTLWLPLGDNAGNFSVVGNQQEDAAAALVEKIVNSIDAVLMGECAKRGVDPESDDAPVSMRQAVEELFGVHAGRLENLSPRQQTVLAERINLVATGDKASPCYSIVDSGEGQTPDDFPRTFLSTSRSSPKIRIDFVQGKFNAGGSGSLQFCGRHNLQLIASRRQPCVRSTESDDLWGFTVIRRRRPRQGERSSVFVYLALEGRVPRFRANTIAALPGKSSKNTPPAAYCEPLSYGTVVKLYNYRWAGRGIATLEARRQLENAVQTPCLPFRITETRQYRANSFATTVVGVWSLADSPGESESLVARMEDGYPATISISLRGIGNLPVRLGVWTTDVQTRNVPTGVFFLVNGQVHGTLPSDFISSQLKLDYIRGHLLVGVDCTNIDRSVSEDLFMASRDRLRRNDHYDEIRATLARELLSHQGLRELNAARRKERTETAGDASQHITDLIGDLIRSDPGLADLFGLGRNLITSTGPGLGTPFIGKKFPTYFRLARSPKNGLLTRSCPVNGTVRIEFETDAENGYFDRAADPGEIEVLPSIDLIEASNLWNGRFAVRFRVPWDAEPGDETEVTFKVNDIERIVPGPFVARFLLVAGPETKPRVQVDPKPDTPANPKGPHRKGGDERSPSLELPVPIKIRRDGWSSAIGIESAYDALRVKHAADGGYDFYVNLDCAWLLTESAARRNDPARVTHWFTWGLTLAALGMIRKLESKSGESNEEPEFANTNPLDLVGKACDGLAQVIIPMFRVLYDGPPPDTH